MDKIELDISDQQCELFCRHKLIFSGNNNLFLVTLAFRMQQKLDYGMHTIPRYCNSVANRQKQIQGFWKTRRIFCID